MPRPKPEPTPAPETEPEPEPKSKSKPKPKPTTPPAATPRTRAEVEAEWEKVRMRFISGTLERSEYLAKVKGLEAELDLLVPAEPVQGARRQAAGGSRAPEATPSDAAVPAWPGSPLPALKRPDPREFDQELVRRLLQAVEERLEAGVISEGTYRELKEKFQKRLVEA